METIPPSSIKSRDRQVEAGKHKQIIAEAGQARDQAAQLTATNRQYVSDVKAFMTL